MIFTWKDGYSKEFKPGASIVGLTRKLERPDTVTLSYDDFSKILKLEKGIDYLISLRIKLKYYGT